MSTGLGQGPFAQGLAQEGAREGGGGPGTVVTAGPITGNGSAGSPVGISPASAIAAGSESAADFSKLAGLPTGASLTASLAALTAGIAGVSANWPVANIRWYAVDYDGGNDANAGFSDVSMAAAGAVAIKTLTHLNEIVPQFGAGRLLVVAIKPRAGSATYRNPGNTADDDLVINWVGYRRWVVRGSADFTDNTADRHILGGITQTAGPGAGGVWTLAAGSTAALLNLTSATFPAEVTATGYRIRFTGNVTAALANIGDMVHTNTAGTVTPAENFPTVPATGDTFLIERPGVAVGNVFVGALAVDAHDSSVPIDNWQLAGIQSTGAIGFRISGCNDSLALCFCEGLIVVTRVNAIAISGSWTNPDGTVTANAGAGFHSVAGFFSDIGTVAISEFADVGTALSVSLQNIRYGQIFRSSVLHKGYAANGCGLIVSPTNAIGLMFGDLAGTTTRRPCRLFGTTVRASHRYGGNASISHLDVTGAAALGAVTIAVFQGHFTVDDVVGSTGNTFVGIDLSTSVQSRFLLGTFVANTVTGTGGDIAVPGASTSHAGLTLTSFIDSAGNMIQGPKGRIIDSCQLVLNQSGGALAVGNCITGNGTSNQVKKATGNSATLGDSSLLGFCVTISGNAANCYIIGAGYAYALFDGAPTPGAIAYLSPTTAGTLTTTVPAVALNNNRLRVGRVVTVISGTAALVAIAPEALAIVATGAP